MKIDLITLHNYFVVEKTLANKSLKTIESYKRSFRVFYNFMKYKELEEINKNFVLIFLNYLKTRTRIISKKDKKIGVKAATLITYKNRLSPFFDWLKLNGYIENNPFNFIEMPKIEEDDSDKILHKNEIEGIFTAISFNIRWANNLIKKRNILIFSLLFYAGIRRGELLNLKILDLDMENKILSIRPSTSKTKKGRKIPINNNLYLILKDYLKERGCYLNPSLLISMRDKPLTNNGLKKIIDLVSKTSKIKFHIHQFRHSFAVNAINNIKDISVVQNLLGHSKITTTAIYLTYIPNEKKKEAVNSLNFYNLL